MKSLHLKHWFIHPQAGLRIVSVLLVFLVFSACQKMDNEEMPLSETAAPAFSLSSSESMNVMLSDYAGKVVVLFFFGSNCPSCKAAGPDIESMLVTPFADRTDYQVLGLDQWNGNLSAVQSFKAATGISFPLLINAASVAEQYKTTYDRLFVIDKSGKIVFSGTRTAASDITAVKQRVSYLFASDSSSLTGTDTLDNKGTAPVFSLLSLSDDTVKLTDYSRRVIVLFFFGYNCPSCIAASPDIISKLVSPYALRNDYIILGLDQWNGNAAGVQSFKNITGFTIPLLMQASGVAAAYKTTYDRLVVIDKSGNIIFKGNNNASSDIDAVKSKVESALLTGK